MLDWAGGAQAPDVLINDVGIMGVDVKKIDAFAGRWAA
jgi:hypothetical protein